MAGPAKVLIFGAGGVGIGYTYVFLQAGASVTAVCRSNYEAASRVGFTLNSALWGPGLKCKPRIVRDTEQAASDSWDYVVVCSKATPTTASLIKPAVQPSTCIVLVQNGIGIEDGYKDLYPNNLLLSGSLNMLATQTRQGHAELGPIEALALGVYPPSASDTTAIRRRDAFVELCHAGGSNARAVEDISQARWLKLMSNASFNPLTALTRLSVPILCGNDAGAMLVRKIMYEIVELANADGCAALTKQDADQRLGSTAKFSESPERMGAETSMLTDVRNERGLEDWAILGNALAIAKKHSVACPTIEVVYNLTQCLNKAVELGSLNRTTKEALQLAQPKANH